MTRVRVAIPVYKGSRRFHLDKGRPWSIFDQMILFAVRDGTQTAALLADQANVPRRLVLETLIRLMRAGWVDLVQDRDGIRFIVTQSGIAALASDELPAVLKRVTRWMGFVIDRVSGTIFRTRDFTLATQQDLTEQAARVPLIKMEPGSLEVEESAPAIVSTLLDDDEVFVAVDPSGERLVERYALVTVSDGVIEGPPGRAPSYLRTQILAAAKQAPSRAAGMFSPTYTPTVNELDASDEIEYLDAVLDAGDILVGGSDHKQELEHLINSAKERLIIHSTFISEGRYEDWSVQLEGAARRGVLVDILWGQEDSPASTTRSAITNIREKVKTSGLDNIRVHAFSTGSHAKFIIADAGPKGHFTGVMGSCNWLVSGFNSIEASLRLRDPRAVSALLTQAAELVRADNGYWGELTPEFLRLAVASARQSPPKGDTVRLAFVLGARHAQLVRDARNEATKRIFVVSHKLSPTAQPMVLIPAIAAAKDKVSVDVYYCRPSGGVSRGDAAGIEAWAASQGVNVKAIAFPRIHAKLLAWDDDNLVITSQNWLSADPGDSNPRRELGIVVRGPGLARTAIEKFVTSIHS